MWGWSDEKEPNNAFCHLLLVKNKKYRREDSRNVGLEMLWLVACQTLDDQCGAKPLQLAANRRCLVRRNRRNKLCSSHSRALSACMATNLAVMGPMPCAARVPVVSRDPHLTNGLGGFCDDICIVHDKGLEQKHPKHIQRNIGNKWAGIKPDELLHSSYSSERFVAVLQWVESDMPGTFPAMRFPISWLI
jgi:hypothetical protein